MHAWNKLCPLLRGNLFPSCLKSPSSRLKWLTIFTILENYILWRIQGRGPGARGPGAWGSGARGPGGPGAQASPLFLDQTEARKGENTFLWDRPPPPPPNPYLKVWIRYWHVLKPEWVLLLISVFFSSLGIGFASIAVSFLVSVYYNVIMAWSLFYFYQAFKKDIPWVGCHHPWNTPDCYVYNASNPNASGSSPSREFLV